MGDIGGARRAGRRWLWICAGIAAAGAVAAVVGIWHLPDWMYPGGGTEMAQARAALQSGLLTAAAALTAVAGGLIALDETRQANTEVRRANAEVRRANENTHVREFYMGAVGLLNAETVDSRLGGIYALERVAMDSPADQRMVVEVLSAYVREHARPPASGARSRPDLTTDVQAALTVLGRLPVNAGFPRADLSGADLTHAWLDGANLSNARLHRANLTDAHLDGVNLTSAGLAGATLTGATLLQATLTDARLPAATLAGARMSGADLTRARLDGANLAGAQLAGATLIETRLEGADLTDAELFGAELTRAMLNEATVLTRAWLDGADLTDARLDRANLTDARGLAAEQVAAASGDARTRLPDGVERPTSWPPYEPPPEL